MAKKASLLSTLRGINGSSVSVIEAYAVTVNPLVLQSVTDNALKIYDSNLLPLGERFSKVSKDAVIYRDGEEESIQIEIDNDIKADDLFVLLQFNMGETCKYYILDKI